MDDEVRKHLRNLHDRVHELERRLEVAENHEPDTTVDDFIVDVERLAFHHLLLWLEVLLPDFSAKLLREQVRQIMLESLAGADKQVPEAAAISEFLRARLDDVISGMFPHSTFDELPDGFHAPGPHEARATLLEWLQNKPDVPPE